MVITYSSRRHFGALIQFIQKCFTKGLYYQHLDYIDKGLRIQIIKAHGCTEVPTIFNWEVVQLLALAVSTVRSRQDSITWVTILKLGKVTELKKSRNTCSLSLH